mmetsp:Transcript_10871/g.16033  ORF Transcript_10871/g.16033 Transcript_10871/m.16033 type:complete len:223 (+) Transcript_10871:36-704(+)
MMNLRKNCLTICLTILAISFELTNAFTLSSAIVVVHKNADAVLTKQSLSASADDASNTSPAERRKKYWEKDIVFETSGSGLMTNDIVVGDGDSPAEGDLISVHYAGWYDSFKEEGYETSGKKFDNSRDRGDEPLQLIYGKAQIIEGWNEGLKSMKVGGKREFIIPPNLGYGDKEVKAPGMPSIPANSYLRFEIELVEVDNSMLTKFRLAIPAPSSLFEKSFF